jgi:hypothetical protein
MHYVVWEQTCVLHSGSPQCILLKVAFFLAFSIHILASISPNITEAVSESQSLSSVASHSRPVASHSQSAHIPVASHSQSAHIAQSPRTVSPLTVASPSLPFLQSRSRIARSRSRADSQSSHLPEEKHHSHPFGARPRGRG